jgi:hypothetical protein
MLLPEIQKKCKGYTVSASFPQMPNRTEAIVFAFFPKTTTFPHNPKTTKPIAFSFVEEMA